MIILNRKEDPGGQPRGWIAWIFNGHGFDARELPRRLRAVLEDVDFSSRAARVLFPCGSREDAEVAAEYARLMRDELLARKLDCLETFEECLDRAEELETSSPEFSILELELSDQELALWLGFLHDVRLVIGTALDIREDNWSETITPDDPHLEEYVLLEQLAGCEQTIVDALRLGEGYDT